MATLGVECSLLPLKLWHLLVDEFFKMLLYLELF